MNEITLRAAQPRVVSFSSQKTPLQAQLGKIGKTEQKDTDLVFFGGDFGSLQPLPEDLKQVYYRVADLTHAYTDRTNICRGKMCGFVEAAKNLSMPLSSTGFLASDHLPVTMEVRINDSEEA